MMIYKHIEALHLVRMSIIVTSILSVRCFCTVAALSHPCHLT